jgi:hypothetical protein
MPIPVPSRPANAKRLAIETSSPSTPLYHHPSPSLTRTSSCPSPSTQMMALSLGPVHSPAGSPVVDPELDYHYLMYLADCESGHAPIGSPPRETPCGPATPCGCPNFESVQTTEGEHVCINCGVVTGRVHGHHLR